VLLVAEVAETSLAYDRDEKQQIYAEARLPVYWIINIVDRQVEVYTDPTGPAALPTYRRRQTFGENDVVPVVLDGQQVGQIAVRDLLP
jgi:Uma2 family endonuclease